MDKDIIDIFETYVDEMDARLEHAHRFAHTFIATDVVKYENFRDICVKTLKEMKKVDTKSSVSKLSK